MPKTKDTKFVIKHHIMTINVQQVLFENSAVLLQHTHNRESHSNLLTATASILNQLHSLFLSSYVYQRGKKNADSLLHINHVNIILNTSHNKKKKARKMQQCLKEHQTKLRPQLPFCS